MPANQTGTSENPIEVLAAAGEKTSWVAIAKGRFNLHVFGDGQGSWRVNVSYDGGTTAIPLETYYEAKKLAPYEGDSLVASGVLYQVEAVELTSGEWKVRIGQ